MISTTNYILPDYTINHSLNEKKGYDIIGTFLNEVKNKIEDINDIDYDENEIVTSLPSDFENENDNLVDVLQEDEIRVKEHLLNDIQEEINDVTPSIEPKSVENINLDELFDDIEVKGEHISEEPESRKSLKEELITSQDTINTEQDEQDRLDMNIYETETNYNDNNKDANVEQYPELNNTYKSQKND